MISYDHVHRLISAQHPTQGTKTYGYTAIGNVLNNGEAGAGGTTYGYGVRMPRAVKNANGKSYAYDANGNMVARAGQRLEYDAENRLASVWVNGTLLASFGYGGDGARLWKSTSTSTQVWIGKFYEEKDGKILFHIFADDKRVCTFDATTTNVFDYYHGDHLGSTSILTDRTGNRVQHYEYTAYGREQHKLSSTAFAVSHRYNGKVLDEDVGLYYYEARYYDADLARFIQPDLIIPHLGNPQSYNRYSYVLNNPLKYVDPDGQQPVRPSVPSAPPVRGVITSEILFELHFQRSAAARLHVYPSSFQRSVERFVSEQNQINTFGRPLRPGEAYWMPPPQRASTSVSPFSQNYDVTGAFGFSTQGRSARPGSARSETTALQPYYPQNSGFLGETTHQFLYPGQRIDRYGGSDVSRFFSPAGTPKEARSLPAATAKQPLRTFEVLKPFEVEAGRITPAFGQPGLGTQYKAPVPLRTLLERGIIREVTPSE